jgi:serine O-acetyltransferase
MMLVAVFSSANAWMMPSHQPLSQRRLSKTVVLWNKASSSESQDKSPPKSSYNLGVGKNLPVGNSTVINEETEKPEKDDKPVKDKKKPSAYDLGAGKHSPVSNNALNTTEHGDENSNNKQLHWYAPDPVNKPTSPEYLLAVVAAAAAAQVAGNKKGPRRVRKMVARTEADSKLRGAIWHETHYDDSKTSTEAPQTPQNGCIESNGLRRPALFYPDIELSIPESVYSSDIDIVWDLMRWEAFQEAQREPLLVSFLYSSILNHPSLESSLAFLLANRLSSPAMISTQIQSLILEALKQDPSIGRSLRADIMAVRDRDPACTCLPDVFLYFKGFHALQTYRVAHVLWNAGKQVLAHYLQSQMSQTFQIDIHPNATLGSGIMLDHGTGIVIGETAHVGHNCSILHHVTLGGSGKKGVDRHPKVGEGVLLGAGASVLGNVKLGDGCQVGAGTLVITDLPAHSVAVGVPAKIIGSFVDVTEQPSIGMNQMMDAKIVTFQSDGI